MDSGLAAVRRSGMTAGEGTQNDRRLPTTLHAAGTAQGRYQCRFCPGGSGRQPELSAQSAAGRSEIPYSRDGCVRHRCRCAVMRLRFRSAGPRDVPDHQRPHARGRNGASRPLRRFGACTGVKTRRSRGRAETLRRRSRISRRRHCVRAAGSAARCRSVAAVLEVVRRPRSLCLHPSATAGDPLGPHGCRRSWPHARLGVFADDRDGAHHQ